MGSLDQFGIAKGSCWWGLRRGSFWWGCLRVFNISQLFLVKLISSWLVVKQGNQGIVWAIWEFLMSLLPSSFLVDKFNASSIHNRYQSHNLCKTHPTQPGHVYCKLKIDHIQLVDSKWISCRFLGQLDITYDLQYFYVGRSVGKK